MLAKDDRDIWISPGYGVEHKLTAGTLGEITRSVIIPEFKRNNYFEGIDKGTDVMIQILSGEYEGGNYSNSNEFPIGVIIFLIIVFIIFMIAISANRRGKGGGRGGRSHKDTSILEAIIFSNMGRSRSTRQILDKLTGMLQMHSKWPCSMPTHWNR